MNAKIGDKVKVHYTLKLDTGEIVESSWDSLPLEFTLGEGKMIPGFENGVIGMIVGEKKTINVPHEQAYGTRNEAMVFEFPRSRCPEGFDPQIGHQVQMFMPNGQSFVVTVKEITQDGFIMDGNHPLAGKNLTFDLELMEIVS